MSHMTHKKQQNDINGVDLQRLCQVKLELGISLDLSPETKMDVLARSIHQQMLSLQESHPALIREYRQLRDQLIVRNHRLVYEVCKRRGGMRGQIDPDVVADGQVGLIRSVDKFDAVKFPHLKLSTYAAYWIWNEIQHRLSDKVGQRRLSRRDTSRVPGLLQYIEQRTHEEGHEVNLQLIADELGMPWKKLQHLLQRVMHPITLQLPDKSASKLEYSGDAVELESQQIDVIQSSLRHLTDQQRHVIRTLYLTANPPSVRTLAKSVGLSASRVLQLKHQGLSILRQCLANEPKLQKNI